MKKLNRKRGSSVRNNLIFNFWENQNLNDIRSLSRSFHGHRLHPRATGFMHAFSFPSKNFFKIPPMNCTPKLCKKKYTSPCFVPLYLAHELKNNTLFLEFARFHSPYYVIFMCRTGCAVQNWGITWSCRVDALRWTTR